ncbi:hypothetical protein C9374_003601 [Naegleria lovaniensis]|uniref:RING-type domain-containing protein n=1 Tax=Naegleria lovaniensis TaxID=51637 RepID=A0AA88H7V9_NAELO|nr:uncharacterized protein C9374_003601 [Naegleria lovaniensis]KAG2393837.1 hypothetical protein C9374_003601 [Naegleria lovaniensis]
MSFYFSDHNVDENNDQHNHLSGDEVIWRIIQQHQAGVFDLDAHSGKPPASNSFLREMEVIWFDPENPELASHKDEDCPICGEGYKKDDQCHQLECNHFFHLNCLKTWLRKHNTCPICRKDTLTDCPEYEEQKLDPNRGKDNVHSMYM